MQPRWELPHQVPTMHGHFKAKPSSYYVHSTLWVTTPNSPCPTLSADAEHAHQRIVQLNVTNMQYKYVINQSINKI